MKKNISKLVIAAIVTIMFSNCNKDNPPPQPPNPSLEKIGYIINEGGFNDENASVSFINITKKIVFSDYFNSVNGFNLGDIAQSMGEYEDNYFIVVNNSAKIEVVNKETFISQLTIENMGSPRYFLGINDTLAYVSDLFAGVVWQIDQNTGSKYQSIAVNGWSEQMEKIGEAVFVTLPGANQIGVIDIDSQALIDSIPIDLSPQKMVKDRFDMLWVVGSVWQGPSKLYKINPFSRAILGEWEFDVDNPLTQLTIDPLGITIYYSIGNDKIFKMNVEALDIPDLPFITSNAITTLYGLSVNEEKKVYACDAGTFSDNGKVLVFNVNGQLQSSIPSGVAPNSIVFFN